MALLPQRLDFINFFLTWIAQSFNFSLPLAPRTISVPRPAMLVAIVTAPGLPA